MLEETERELGKVASFLNIDATAETLARAVKLSWADRMRSLEKKQSRQWKLTKDTRQDKPFVRSAKSGDWKDVLSENSVAAIEVAWGPVMQKLGYELSIDVGGQLRPWVSRRE